MALLAEKSDALRALALADESDSLLDRRLEYESQSPSLSVCPAMRPVKKTTMTVNGDW